MDHDDIPQIENPISVFPKPQRMFPEDQRVPGGQYLNARTKEDMTGHKAAAASIGVHPGGKPYFNASGESVDETGSSGRGNATAKTNLFKQKAGWKWVDAPEGHEETNTIVSVEHRGHHHYALNAHFPKGVDLARYENSPSEPRLRPTTKGNVAKGNQVGSISVRGKEHPVYDHLIVKEGGGEVDGNDGITAYHGSPHDFEQFDTSKIGTGEGAQSYGHGLYFAQAEPTAVGYRDELSHNNQTPIMVDDKRHEPYSSMQRMVADYRGDVDAVIKQMSPKWESIAEKHAKLPKDADELERLLSEYEHHSAQKERAEVESMRGKTVKYGKRGHMYEVHINAHPHHMLDWDKPLSEQSSHITKSLFDARKEMPTLWEKTQHHINNDSTAGDFYQSIAAGHPHGYAGATDQLSRAGIKGIKYLDAGSRGDKAEPTHNYVVFDHNDVHIKRKYEQGGQVEGYAEGGDIMDDSRVKRTGEGGQESALDFIQNTPLYKQRIEDQKQPQPQAAPAPAPQTESKPMPVIAAPPPAIIRAAEPAPPAPVQQQPQAQGQTGLFHIGTNDIDPNVTVKSAQRIIDASRTMGIDPVFLLPNQAVKKPYAETSKALQKYLDDNGIQYHMPEYEPGDPAHMSHEWVNNFAKTYNNPFIAGDSNSVRLGTWGYGAKGTALVHPDSKAVLGRVGAGSKDIANELEKHVKWYQQNKKNGGSVIHRMHFEDGGDPSGGDNQGSSVGDPSSDFGGNDMGNDGGGGGGGNDNTPEPATTVDEEKPEEKTKPASPMPLTPQNMGTNLRYDPIPSATFTPATPTALPPTTSFQQFAGGGLVDAALKKISSKYTDTGLPLNAMEILSKIARTG